MDYTEYLESRSDVLLGKPIIKGTRITVELILKKLSEGATTDDILDVYPHLQAVHVNAALAHATDVISSETLIPAA